MIRLVKDVCRALVVVVGLGASAGTHMSQTHSTRQEAAWYWYGGCRDNKTLGLEIVLNGKSVQRSSLRICHMRGENLPPLKEGPNVAFSFRGGHTFQGEYRTSPKDFVKGNIWQAGGEPDGLLLGISFSTEDRVLLNTVHLAKPDGLSESKLDSGLLVKTYPEPRSRP